MARAAYRVGSQNRALQVQKMLSAALSAPKARPDAPDRLIIPSHGTDINAKNGGNLRCREDAPDGVF